MPRKVTPNQIDICGEVAHILLPCGSVCTIDTRDIPKIVGYCWRSMKRRKMLYVGYNRPQKGIVLLHRHLLGTKCPPQVDHIDGDGLNNRRSNLRAATNKQNQENITARSHSASGIRGVMRLRSGKKIYWGGQVVHNDKKRTRYFPLTDDGKEQARQWCIATRAALFTHDDRPDTSPKTR